jgi:hypothetical protein
MIYSEGIYTDQKEGSMLSMGEEANRRAAVFRTNSKHSAAPTKSIMSVSFAASVTETSHSYNVRPKCEFPFN